MTEDTDYYDESTEIVRSKQSKLQRMRELQSKLARAWEREISEQKEQDAKARKLIEDDPSGHVEMIKPEQEHRKLAVELPRMLLKREAEVYEEMQQAQKAAAARQPETSKMMGKMISMEKWSLVPLLALGLWLIFSPFTAGYSSMPLIWNNIISGILVIILTIVALRTGRSWAASAIAAIGLWLAFTPVLFWAPEAAAYMNNTLVGVFVFAFSAVIPMRRNMHGPEVPHGWSYNPSSWLQRAPIAALALLSFLLTQYMAAFQLGHIDWAWDPIFGDDTVTVLTSSISRAFPISDAGWGAWIYLVEFLSVLVGGTRRWRTMPWMVATFGFFAVPLSAVSILFVIFQPVIVGAWCTICLITAVFVVLIIALSLDEILAMIGYLRQTRRAGKSVWRTFLHGGEALGDNLTPQRNSGITGQTRDEMFWGVNVPWKLVVVAGLGLWLMAAPAVFQVQGLDANINYVLGPLVLGIAIISLAEVARSVRLVNLLLAAGLMVLPWLLDGGAIGYNLNNLVIGAAIIMLSIPPGKIKNSYGSWNRAII